MSQILSAVAQGWLPRIQFRIRSLVIGTSLVAAALAPVRAEMARCQAIQCLSESICQNRGELFFDYQLIEEGVVLRQLDSSQPTWIRRAIGSHAFADIVEIRLDDCRANSTVYDEIGQNCPQLLHFSARGSSIANESLKSIARCKQLQVLDLSGTPISDVGVEYFASHTQLSTICLEGTRISGVCCLALAKLPSLKIVTLDHSAVDDSDVVKLADSKSVEMLFLTGTEVSDAIIPHLARIPTLKSVGLSRTAITPAGREQLRKLRPEISQI